VASRRVEDRRSLSPARGRRASGRRSARFMSAAAPSRSGAVRISRMEAADGRPPDPKEMEHGRESSPGKADRMRQHRPGLQLRSERADGRRAPRQSREARAGGSRDRAGLTRARREGQGRDSESLSASDEMLARRASSGDTEAFETLVARYEARVYSLS